MLRTGAILVSVVILGLLPFALSLGAGQVPALRGIERVSVADDGSEGNAESGTWHASLVSADGRYVAFHSDASDLVANDWNEKRDVFVHDRQTGQTKRMSVSSEGAQGNRRSSWPRISADGRCVAFESAADNLVPDDSNRVDDVFVYDRDTGRTTRANVAGDGAQSKQEAHLASLSGDGRNVVFVSGANDLVPDDTNNAYDVFVHDRQTGQTKRASVGNNGAQSNQGAWEYSISGDGRYVVFASSADNLVPGDSNKYSDIFVHDCQTGQTARVNLGQGGAEADWDSAMPSLSPDGRCVVFASKARNLVRRDINEAADVFLAPNPLFVLK